MSDVSQILSQIKSGDSSAADQLLLLVYDKLRKLASAKLWGEKPGQTLQATALVREEYLRILGNGSEQRWSTPFVVTRVEGDRLGFGKSFVQRSDVLPLEEASHCYSNIIQVAPDSGFAYYQRGIVSRALGDFDHAIEDFSAAIGVKDNFNNWFELWNRGMVLLEDKKEFDKALSDFDECIRLYPLDDSSHVVRGITQVKRGELDDALKSFNEAIRLGPKNGWSYAMRAHAWSVKRGKRQYDARSRQSHRSQSRRLARMEHSSLAAGYIY